MSLSEFPPSFVEFARILPEICPNTYIGQIGGGGGGGGQRAPTTYDYVINPFHPHFNWINGDSHYTMIHTF